MRSLHFSLPVAPSFSGKSLFLLLVLCFCYSGLFSQKKSRNQLEKEKRENLRKIEQTREILREVKKEKKASISQLLALRQQEKLKEKTIGSIREELGILDSDISHLQSEEEKLAYTLAKMKQEYAAMIYAASKADKGNFLIFLLASESVNHFLNRLHLLRQYATERKMQEKQIRQLSLQLNQQKLKLAEARQNKEVLLSQEKKEKQQIEILKNDQKKVVSQLSEKEKQLKEKIEKHQAALRRLENLIASMVSREIKKSRAGSPASEVRKSEAGSSMVLTPEGQVISRSFAGNRGRLSWPVESGFISSRFGKQEHPVLRKIYIDNLGIDITTRPGSKVLSVFEGEVAMTSSVPGMDGQIVMVKHGDFFTVYSNLRNLRVSRGDKVKRRQAIGDVKSGEEGPVLKFQIWKNSKRLNPQTWLAAQ